MSDANYIITNGHLRSMDELIKKGIIDPRRTDDIPEDLQKIIKGYHGSFKDGQVRMSINGKDQRVS